VSDSSRSHRILVVDDEQNIAEVVAMALRYQGFDVEMAGDGAGALAAVEDFRPELVVLDIMLPDLDGFEIVHRLRGRRNQVRIVFLTARDAGEDKLRGLTSGGDDYVTKPFSLEELTPASATSSAGPEPRHSRRVGLSSRMCSSTRTPAR
jgi:two-component system OmpR family response regulator